MRTFVAALGLLLLALPPLGSARGGQEAPINAKCPVKPNQAARAANTVVFRGKVVGFC
jgi:hypothetical protein